VGEAKDVCRRLRNENIILPIRTLDLLFLKPIYFSNTSYLKER